MRRALAGGLMALAAMGLGSTAAAHDGWVQSNVSRVEQGDAVYLDLQFGNHGDDHRNYRIYGTKWSLPDATFRLLSPSGAILDLKPWLIDVGFDEVRGACVDRNGYLVASFVAESVGLYVADIRQDMVVSYAPERSIKGAKAFVASLQSTMASRARPLHGFDLVLGQPLEIVPLSDPTSLAVGDSLKVRVLFKGQPHAMEHLAVIPRGGEPVDLMTDREGYATLPFSEANYHLVVTHAHTDESGSLGGKPYAFTKYAATMTVLVRPSAK